MAQITWSQRADRAMIHSLYFIFTGNMMNWQKFLVGTLFFIMAVGGAGGLMLVGYTIILHA